MDVLLVILIPWSAVNLPTTSWSAAASAYLLLVPFSPAPPAMT